MAHTITSDLILDRLFDQLQAAFQAARDAYLRDTLIRGMSGFVRLETDGLKQPFTEIVEHLSSRRSPGAQEAMQVSVKKFFNAPKHASLFEYDASRLIKEMLLTLPGAPDFFQWLIQTGSIHQLPMSLFEAVTSSSAICSFLRSRQSAAYFEMLFPADDATLRTFAAIVKAQKFYWTEAYIPALVARLQTAAHEDRFLRLWKGPQSDVRATAEQICVKCLLADRFRFFDKVRRKFKLQTEKILARITQPLSAAAEAFLLTDAGTDLSQAPLSSQSSDELLDLFLKPLQTTTLRAVATELCAPERNLSRIVFQHLFLELLLRLSATKSTQHLEFFLSEKELFQRAGVLSCLTELRRAAPECLDALQFAFIANNFHQCFTQAEQEFILGSVKDFDFYTQAFLVLGVSDTPLGPLQEQMKLTSCSSVLGMKRHPTSNATQLNARLLRMFERKTQYLQAGMTEAELTDWSSEVLRVLSKNTNLKCTALVVVPDASSRIPASAYEMQLQSLIIPAFFATSIDFTLLPDILDPSINGAAIDREEFQIIEAVHQLTRDTTLLTQVLQNHIARHAAAAGILHTADDLRLCLQQAQTQTAKRSQTRM